MVIVSLIPTLIYYYSLHALGNPVGNLDTPGIIGAYIGMVLLGGVFTAVGVLASALAQNQIVSFISSAFMCYVLYAGFESISGMAFWGDSAAWVESLGILFHYNSLSRGVIDFTDIAYFFGLGYLLILLTVLVMKRK